MFMFISIFRDNPAAHMCAVLIIMSIDSRYNVLLL